MKVRAYVTGILLSSSAYSQSFVTVDFVSGPTLTYSDPFESAQPMNEKSDNIAKQKTPNFIWTSTCQKPANGKCGSSGHMMHVAANKFASWGAIFQGGKSGARLGREMSFTIPARDIAINYTVAVSQEFVAVTPASNPINTPSSVYMIAGCKDGVRSSSEVDLSSTRPSVEGLARNVSLTLSIPAGSCPSNQFYVRFNAENLESVDIGTLALTRLE